MFTMQAQSFQIDRNSRAFQLGWNYVQTGIVANAKRPWRDDWAALPPYTEAMAQEDDARGCGIGVRCGVPIDPFSGHVIVGIDIDVTDVRMCSETLQHVLRVLGDAPRRVGRPPKVLLPYKVIDVPAGHEIRKSVVKFKDRAGTKHKIEMLAFGQQFVAAGVHPDTGQAFTRTPDFLTAPPSQLPAIRYDQLVQLMETLPSAVASVGGIIDNTGVPAGSPVPTGGDRRKLSPEQVELIMQTLPPNDMARIDYDEWIGIMHGIHGICEAADMLAEGRDLWLEWSTKGDPDVALAERKWDTLRDARYGFTHLMSVIERFQGAMLRAAVEAKADKMQPAADFHNVPLPSTMPVSPVIQKQAEFASDLEDAVSQGGWSGLGMDPLRWVDKGHLLLRGNMKILAGRPGEGKSLYALNYILDLMAGTGILSDGAYDTSKPLRCLYVSADDDREMVAKRLRAFCRKHGIDPAQFDAGFRAFTVADQGFEKLGLSDSKAVLQLAETLRKERIDVILLDPLVNLMGVKDENDNAAVIRVMQNIKTLAALTDVAVLLVHHTRKGVAGDTSREFEMDDVRGAGAITGAVRGAVMMQSMSKEQAEHAGLNVDHRQRYARVFDVKTSYGVQDLRGKWFEKQSVGLGNATSIYPEEELPVIMPWTLPNQGLPSPQEIQNFLSELEHAPAGVYTTSARNSDISRDVYLMGEKLGLTKKQVDDTIEHLTKCNYIRSGKSAKNRKGQKDVQGILVDNVTYDAIHHVTSF